MINPNLVTHTVKTALQEDVGDGDITASLIPLEKDAVAEIISREAAIICGIPWVNEVYKQVNPKVRLEWHFAEGEAIFPNKSICNLAGPAQSLLTGERTALNFLQMLSGTATTTKFYVDELTGTKTVLLDTRKTIPGLRAAQKYAVKCGGGQNHRMGLFDAYLIKENHIRACGSITQAIYTARSNHPDKTIEIEVENLAELTEALESGAHIILLDNFDFPTMQEAVRINNKRAKLEVSGSVTQENLKKIAAIGIDFISVGAITKHIRAIDFSLLFN